MNTTKNSPLTVLLIDDEDEVRFALSTVLNSFGYQVVEAKNGLEALSLVEKYAFDVVVCDIIMPMLDGIETIKSILERRPNAKIIAISGGGRIDKQDYLMLALHMGAKKAMAKPFGSAQLGFEIAELLSA